MHVTSEKPPTFGVVCHTWASLLGTLPMPKQLAFPFLRDAMKEKLTQWELFLAEMNAGVPWGRLLALIAPHCPKVGPTGGRPPMSLET